MMKSFASFDLTTDQVAAVFPLVQAAFPEMDLARWRDCARLLVEGAAASGAIGMRNVAGYVCGLLVFRVDHDFRHSKVFAVDLFVALDVLSEDEAAGALLQVAEAKARALHCNALHIRSGTRQRSLAGRLAVAGYSKEAEVFCRHLAPSAPPN